MKVINCWSCFVNTMWSNNSRSTISRGLMPQKRNSFITVFILGCIIFIFLLAYVAFGTEEVPEPTLIQIHVLFRHGERTPSTIYPTDPNKNHKWFEGLGALTNKGKYTMYTLGQTLRKRYGQFLGQFYLPEDITILSSYAPRCQMSAMTLLAGLYPPVNIQIWNKELLWQPILIDVIPRISDNLIAAKAPCKAFDIEKQKSDVQIKDELTDSERKLFMYLSEHTGSVVNNIEHVEFLYATLKIEDEHGLEIPAWARSVYPEPMREIAARNLASYTRTSILKRLQGGPLLKQWMDHMKFVEKKAYYYSGHDLTVVNIMRAMGFDDPHFLPDYGATIVFELHHTGNEKFVKALYYNSSQSYEPVSLKFPVCVTPLCPLEKIVEYFKPNVPEDWKKECDSVV